MPFATSLFTEDFSIPQKSERNWPGVNTLLQRLIALAEKSRQIIRLGTDGYPATHAGLQAALSGGTAGVTRLVQVSGSISGGNIVWPTTYQAGIIGDGAGNTRLNFTHTDGSASIYVGAPSNDDYRPLICGVQLFGGANTGHGIHLDGAAIGAIFYDLFIQGFSGTGKAGIRLEGSFIGALRSLTIYSCYYGMEFINSKGYHGSDLNLADNTVAQVKGDSLSNGNSLHFSEIGRGTGPSTMVALDWNGKNSRFEFGFHENFQAAREVYFGTESHHNELLCDNASNLDVYDDGEENVYPISYLTHRKNLVGSSGFSGTYLADGSLENRFGDSSWLGGAADLHFDPFGATPPTRSHETALGFLDSNSLKLDWGTTALSGVVGDTFYSVTAGQWMVFAFMIRADRALLSSEKIVAKILGAANENRAEVHVSDLKQDEWRYVEILYRVTTTESVKINITLSAPATHTALVTYVDDVLVSIEKKRHTLLMNHAASTRSVAETLFSPSLAVDRLALYDSSSLGGRACGLIASSAALVNSPADTNENTLVSLSVPGNTLWRQGHTLRIRAWGVTAANARTKQIKIKWGANIVADSTAVAANNKSWEVNATIVRETSTSARSIGRAHLDTEQDPVTRNMADSLSSSLTLAITAQVGGAPASGDVVLRGWTVERL